MIEQVTSTKRLYGTIRPPGDKSISHRAALLNSISKGSSHVSNFCVGDDRTSMLGCLAGLGVNIVEHKNCKVSQSEECFEIEGRGLNGLTEPTDVLYAGNSGTTMRLVSGLLAGQNFFSVLTGDSSLRGRPMRRITRPLEKMGAIIDGRGDKSLAPLSFRGANLQSIEYDMPVASAQLKSCLLIAGLYADGDTVLNQPATSRDHTERMLSSMGAEIITDELTITLKPDNVDLQSTDVAIPSDTSGSAFWIVAACCHPDATIKLMGVGMNPTRTGILEVLNEMGADIQIENSHTEGGEPTADLIVSTSDLQGLEISGDVIPRVVDELPILALAACFAKGTTVIKDAEELRVKESDRISATVESLKQFGANITETNDGMVIEGGYKLTAATVSSHGDHRIAMTNGIAGLLVPGTTTIENSENASVSYPDFWSTITQLIETNQ
jgi:3-phosphoshikimate 1-carboxyvinyltransferase